MLAGAGTVQRETNEAQVFKIAAGTVGTGFRVYEVRLASRLKNVPVRGGVECYDIETAPGSDLARCDTDLAISRTIDINELQNHCVATDLAIYGNSAERNAGIVA